MICISVLVTRKSEKVGGSSLFLQQTGKVYFWHTIAVNIILIYRAGRCGCQEIPAVFTAGHFPRELQGNLNCSCLDQAVATSYCWEKSSKCQ